MKYLPYEKSVLTAGCIWTALLLILFGVPQSVYAQDSASVQAISGQAYIAAADEGDSKDLQRGDRVGLWKTVRTEAEGKLLLDIERAFSASMGPLSTVFLSSSETDGRTIPDLQVIEGAVRAVSTGSDSDSYSVTTPIISLSPTSAGKEADFVVEVYEPTVTMVTVLKGEVRIKDLSSEKPAEETLKACRSMRYEEGKAPSESFRISATTAEKLISDTTVQGSAISDVQVCEMEKEEPSRGARRYEEPAYTYIDPEYYVDYYPYDRIECLPPRRAGGPLIVILPGIGRWLIPYSTYQSWGVGPDVVQLYATQYLLQQAFGDDYYRWNYLRAREREYYDTLYLAQMTGNTRLLTATQRDLDYIRLRRNLMSRRLGGLRSAIRDLRQVEGDPLPDDRRTARILNSLRRTFTSAENSDLAREFRNRIQAQNQIGDRLAVTAVSEINELRSKIAQTANPAERIRLQQNLDRVRSDLQAGRIPLPEDKREVKDLMQRMAEVDKPDRQERIRKQIIDRLGEGPRFQAADLLESKDLNELKKQIQGKAPEKRQQLQKRLSDLENTIRQRKQLEESQQRIDKTLSEALQTKDEEQRQQLLDRLKNVPEKAPKGLKGPLKALSEQQSVGAALLTDRDEKRQEQLQQRLRQLGETAEAKIPAPEEARDKLPRPDLPSPAAADRPPKPGKQQPGKPPEAVEDRTRDLKRRAKEAAERAEEQRKKAGKRLQEEAPEKPGQKVGPPTPQDLEKLQEGKERLRKLPEKAEQPEPRRKPPEPKQVRERTPKQEEAAQEAGKELRRQRMEQQEKNLRKVQPAKEQPRRVEPPREPKKPKQVQPEIPQTMREQPRRQRPEPPPRMREMREEVGRQAPQAGGMPERMPGPPKGAGGPPSPPGGPSPPQMPQGPPKPGIIGK